MAPQETQDKGIAYRLGSSMAQLWNAARHPESISISRRVGIAGALATAAMIEVVVVGCASIDGGDPNPSCDTYNGADTCDSLPELPVPSEYTQELTTTIQPFLLLVPPFRQHVKIKIHPAVKDTAYDGQGMAVEDVGDYRVTNIDLFIKDTSESELTYGKQVAFHEAAHIFDLSTGDTIPSNYLNTQIGDRLRGLSQDDNAKALSLLTESTYTKRHGQGHPGDNFRELLASTLSVMAIAPGELVGKISDSSISENVQKIVALTCLHAVKSLREFAADSDYSKLSMTDFLTKTQFPYTMEFLNQLILIAGESVDFFDAA